MTGAATDENGNAVAPEDGDPGRFTSADEVGEQEKAMGNDIWPNFSLFFAIFKTDSSILNPYAKEAGDGRSYTAANTPTGPAATGDPTS